MTSPAPWRARKVLLTGAEGQLGREFLRRLGESNVSVTATNRATLDLSRPESLVLPSGDFDVLINCAAYTNVDGAETPEGRKLADQVNAEAVGTMARQCADRDIFFVHFSTDYVFDGKGSVPYSVDHPRAPINAYGESKAKGELELERSEAQALLLRTSWVYAPWGQNFLLTMKRLLSEKTELRVVDDQRGRPTHVATLAEVTRALLVKEATGTFHVCDDGECTWFEFSRMIAAEIHSSCRVVPCTTAEFPRPATRPAYSVLALDRTVEAIGALPALPVQLRAALRGSELFR